MISRRNIRVKVMQTLYSYTSSLDTDKPLDPQKTLRQHFSQTRSLMVYVVHFLTEIARYAEKDAFRKSHKYIPSEKDLNVNTKLAGSNLLWQILDLNEVKLAFKNEKTEQLIDEELVRKIYMQLTTSQQYLHYINIQQQSLQEDRKIFEYIFNDLMLGNEEFVAHVEEIFSNWDDDGEMIVQSVAAFIRKPQATGFQQIITSDKEQFAVNLLKTAIDKEDYLLTLITPKLKNWDPERIALLDMVLMKLGVAEFLYFETIPPKVTINEYIDLAKDYSTAQSGHFVNGILDNIHKELVEEGKLKKKDFRKS
ncbi:transcription antitermination factor NusB [Niabella sp. CJ426]|uniref:transcription antitermination factor NusB n=1 Tax=Niabella sp. CJ426 TaxID=3393740 RepID=UPI003D08CECD